MITISPLSPANFDAVVALRVTDEQRPFVASNVLSIAQSKIWNYLVPVVITESGSPIGFVLYGEDPESHRVYLVRLMVDHVFQRRGHGAAAIRLILAELQEAYDCREVFVSVVPGNHIAGRLFRSEGFSPTGETYEDGEVIYYRKLDKSGHPSRVF